jgi:ADP-ribosyl-[dinitrogen reductase] hydrolase
VRDFRPSDPRLPVPLQAGQWTDDTQMTLCVLRSLVKCGDVDPADMAAEFIAPPEGTIRFSGFSTTYAIRRLKKGIPWTRSGLTDERSAGNGAAMRIAPVGLWDCQDLAVLPEHCRLASMITHNNAVAIAGATAAAYLVARAATGDVPRERLLDEAVDFIGPGPVADHLRRAQELLRAGTPTEAALKTLGTTGYVVHTIASAAYCWLKTPEDFETTVVAAVMGGHDADTTAAIAGNLSGAFNGIAAIPSRWAEKVERSADIAALAQALYERWGERTAQTGWPVR